MAETFNFYVSCLNERRSECLKELEKAYSTQQVQLSLFGQRCHESLDGLEQMGGFMEKLVSTSSPRDIQLFQASLETRLSAFFASLPQFDLASSSQLEFISNFQAIQVGVRNQFGYVKAGAEVGQQGGQGRQPPISRPSTTYTTNSSYSQQLALLPSSTSLDKMLGYDYQNNFQRNFQSGLQINNTFTSSLDIFGNLDCLSSSPPDYNSLTSNAPPGLGAPTPQPPIVYPPKNQIKRQKMIYHCKFGEFGILEGQFTEPSGVAITQDNEIVVADTNNHRIQVFDKEGNFKFQFGEVGKRDGQLLYPNRVAVVATSGDIVVTERSPTHQVKIYHFSCITLTSFPSGSNLHQVWSVRPQVWS